MKGRLKKRKYLFMNWQRNPEHEKVFLLIKNKCKLSTVDFTRAKSKLSCTSKTKHQSNKNRVPSTLDRKIK